VGTIDQSRVTLSYMEYGERLFNKLELLEKTKNALWTLPGPQRGSPMENLQTVAARMENNYMWSSVTLP